METAWTPTSAADGVEQALKILEGRWKLVILFHLFGGKLLRFSDLERAIPAISQKMLIQQLRQMEKDGVVRRIVHQQVPPKVEYGLTDWGTGALSGARRAAEVGGVARGHRGFQTDGSAGSLASDRGIPACVCHAGCFRPPAVPPAIVRTQDAFGVRGTPFQCPHVVVQH